MLGLNALQQRTFDRRDSDDLLAGIPDGFIAEALHRLMKLMSGSRGRN